MSKPERFLSRWSRRKLEALRASPDATPSAAAAPAASSLPVAAEPAQSTVVATSPPAELPPVESLTFDSDFTAFLRPGVDPTVKSAALKQLFSDPRFNVMDGLDVYIDDYSKADPIPPDMLAELMERFELAGSEPSAPVRAAERDGASEPESPAPTTMPRGDASAGQDPAGAHENEDADGEPASDAQFEAAEGENAPFAPSPARIPADPASGNESR